MAPPQYILTANESETDKDKQIANLKAMVDEREQVAKKAMDEKEKLEAMDDTHKKVAKAIKAAYEHDGREIPVVKAKLQAMYDEEKDEAKKAVIKAALEVFDEGNGEQVDNKTQVGETQDEPATKVVEAAIAKAIKPFQDEKIKPIIAKILKANQIGGATADELTALTAKLTAKTFDQIVEYEAENRVLIASMLQKDIIENNFQSLTASTEAQMPFNGLESTALVGNAISIDSALEGVPAQ